MNHEILAACWTSAGNAGPGMGSEASPESLEDRIAAASEAGWDGMGLSNIDLDAVIETEGVASLATTLKSSGIRHLELEFLDHWWEGRDNETAWARRTSFLDAARQTSIRNVKISADLGTDPRPFATYVEELRLLAQMAADAGTRVAVEPMPMAHFSDVSLGMELIEAVGHPNAGLCVDIWHVARAGTPYSALKDILDTDKVFVVELDDAAAEVHGTLWDDTVKGRRYCGEGDLDTTRFVLAMADLGWRGYWGVEILSDAHRATPLNEGMRRAADATRSVLREAEALRAS